MFTNFHTFYPYPTPGLLLHYRIHGIEHMLGGRFTTHVRHDPEVDETVPGEILEPRKVRIVGGGDHGVIEHLVQPRPDGLQAAEIEAPLVVVEVMTRKHEPERERVAVEEAAMRMVSPPLPEATRQALVEIIGLGRPESACRVLRTVSGDVDRLMLHSQNPVDPADRRLRRR